MLCFICGQFCFSDVPWGYDCFTLLYDAPLHVSLNQTQGVLGSLPEDMRHTLTRPGMMHTLPRPLQDLLLPSNPTPASARLLTAEYEQGATQSSRHRRPAGREGFSIRGQGDAGPRAIEGGGVLLFLAWKVVSQLR